MRSGGDASTRVSLSELTDPSDPHLSALAALLQRTFPDPDTVLDLGRLQEFLSASDARRRFCVLVALDGSETVVGGSVFNYVVESNCGFSEYLVLDPAYRGHGLGRALVEARAATLHAEAAQHGHPSCNGVFIEVDSPIRTPSALLAAERETSLDAMERVKLFAHLGFGRVDIRYVQPPLGVGKDAVEYLDLLFAPFLDTSGVIPVEWVVETLEAIWSAWAPETFAGYLADVRRQAGTAEVALLDPLGAE